MSQILIGHYGGIRLPDNVVNALHDGAGDRGIYEFCEQGVSFRGAPTTKAGARLPNPTPALPSKEGRV